MTTAPQKVLTPSLASIALILAAPTIAAAQSLSARPASISLTVVVPAPAAPTPDVIPGGGATVIGRTSTAVDLETRVGLGDRSTSRIEVRLGTAWGSDSARVWVRNRSGTFEELRRNAMIVALDSPVALTGTASAVRFRIEPTRPSTLAAVSVPVEYRLTSGVGDQIAVWSFPTLIRVDAAR